MKNLFIAIIVAISCVFFDAKAQDNIYYPPINQSYEYYTDYEIEYFYSKRLRRFYYPCGLSYWSTYYVSYPRIRIYVNYDNFWMRYYRYNYLLYPSFTYYAVSYYAPYWYNWNNYSCYNNYHINNYYYNYTANKYRKPYYSEDNNQPKSKSNDVYYGHRKSNSINYKQNSNRNKDNYTNIKYNTDYNANRSKLNYNRPGYTKSVYKPINRSSNIKTYSRSSSSNYKYTRTSTQRNTRFIRHQNTGNRSYSKPTSTRTYNRSNTNNSIRIKR